MDVDLRKLAEAILSSSKRRSTGPRSRLVDAIMVLLLSRPLRAAEIAEVFGLESKYVSSYLSYWKTRGLVDYDQGFWYLTPEGEEYARAVVERAKASIENEYERIAKTLISEPGDVRVKPTRKSKKGARGEEFRGEFQSFIVGKTVVANNKRHERLSRVICVQEALKDLLDEEEFEIMNFLLMHYSKWGSTYIYLDQMQERLQAEYTWLLRRIRSLQTKNLVYVYTDPRLGIRIGLSKKVKEIMASCS